MNKKKTPAGQMALGGVLGALAVVIMSLGTLIPVMTYVCPMACALLLEAVRLTCGQRVAWAWYGAVALLGLLLSPDKEAAALYAFMGYYPIVKPKLDGKKLSWLFKGVLFNGSIVLMYFFLLRILGIEALTEEFREMGGIMLAVLLLLGNVTFFLLDRLLSKLGQKWKGKR
ncbi:MAG: hypothetical protein MR883_09255 [Clostridiales bacterium]|nr:hypothetical protein [Clostridiales bacterium]MCI7575007.1 hypothetical protein [Clostridiales bacterium]